MSRRNAFAFRRQGEITFSPQPTNQNCMDAVLIWKSNKARKLPETRSNFAAAGSFAPNHGLKKLKQVL
jgi:hypothetical protein